MAACSSEIGSRSDRRLSFAGILMLAALLFGSGCGPFFENRPRVQGTRPGAAVSPHEASATTNTTVSVSAAPTTAAPPKAPPAATAPSTTVSSPPLQEPKQGVIHPPKINLDAERRNLLEADAMFSRASEDEGAADAFYDHLTPDALLLLPGEVPIKGVDAIKVHLTVNRPDLFIWRARDAKVAEGGDLGYTWGTYELRSYNVDTRNPVIHYGKYLMVWKKQSDGLWKASVISASPSPPPTERR